MKGRGKGRFNKGGGGLIFDHQCAGCFCRSCVETECKVDFDSHVQARKPRVREYDEALAARWLWQTLRICCLCRKSVHRADRSLTVIAPSPSVPKTKTRMSCAGSRLGLETDQKPAIPRCLLSPRHLLPVDAHCTALTFKSNVYPRNILEVGPTRYRNMLAQPVGLAGLDIIET